MKNQKTNGRSAGFYRLLSLALAFLLFAAIGAGVWDFFTHHYEAAGTVHIQRGVPHADAIRKIIEPLRYSGIHHLTDPDAFISLDLESKKWRLNNIRKFGTGGELLLEENRFGLCGDLAVYAYQKIEPLFSPDKYRIYVVKASEAGFFHTNTGSHYILMIEQEKLAPSDPDRMYFLDPSLRRYGRRSIFDQYAMFRRILPDAFAKSMDYANVFDINRGPPILIRRNYMLSFAIGDVDGVFDENNYMLKMFATKKYAYIRPILFTIVKKQGEIVMTQKQNPFADVIPPDVYKPFMDQLARLFTDIRIEKASPASG